MITGPLTKSFRHLRREWKNSGPLDKTGGDKHIELKPLLSALIKSVGFKIFAVPLQVVLLFLDIR